MNDTPKSALEIGEAEAAAVAQTPNRVTLDRVNSRIREVEYINPIHAKHFTIAIVHLQNGYLVTGESAPADPKNFDVALGQKLALENAKRKIWALEGYLLCEMLASEPESA